jgi:biopolymer transport protein ExbB/biopolymer transport protein TolQ
MDLKHIFAEMTVAGWAVVIILLFLSIYSIGVMIDKFRTFRAARRESVQFLPRFVRCLKEDKLQEAVEVSRAHKRSHLAKIMNAGVMEYLNEDERLAAHSRVEAVTRALERSNALTSAEMKKGLGGLATIGSTAPFIGLFGTVVGIINAFQGIAASGSSGIAAVSAGISEALIATAIGLFVAIPAVMAFNYFTGTLERLQVEMTNSAAELLDFFLKRLELANEKG